MIDINIDKIAITGYIASSTDNYWEFDDCIISITTKPKNWKNYLTKKTLSALKLLWKRTAFIKKFMRHSKAASILMQKTVSLLKFHLTKKQPF